MIEIIYMYFVYLQHGGDHVHRSNIWMNRWSDVQKVEPDLCSSFFKSSDKISAFITWLCCWRSKGIQNENINRGYDSDSSDSDDEELECVYIHYLK